MPEQRELPLTFPELSPEALLIPVRMVSLDEHFATAYGIFGVAPTSLAVLRFAAERARWVRRRAMASTSIGGGLDDGRYELQVPCSGPRELVMDILRHGPDVEVMAPPELRAVVAGRLRAASGQYGGRPIPERVL